MIAAYRHPDRAAGRHAMTRLIIALSAGVPAALTELRTLGRTLKRRATDILAYFDRPGTSNGPTEAMNGRLEHLRGSAIGFRNLTHYHRQKPARGRRLPATTTPSFVKSPFSRASFA